MEEQLACQKCHQPISADDYFCPNCGKDLKPAPPKTTFLGQLSLYTKSVLFPPFGLFWAFPYLRYDDKKTKVVGAVAVVLTIVALIYSIIVAKNFIHSFNTELNKQLDATNIF